MVRTVLITTAIAYQLFTGAGLLSDCPCAFADSESDTPEMGAALATISRDADYVAEHVVWEKRLNPQRIREFAVALSAANFVQQRVSSLQYGYRLSTTPQDLPTTVQSSLHHGAGICGNQIAVYIDLVRRLGLTARSVEVYWQTALGQPLSHVGVEVRLGGKWRYFDVTWGAYFVEKADDDRTVPFYERILSFEDVLRLPASKRRRITNESALVYQLQVEQRIDPFEYVSAETSVLYGKTGTVMLNGENRGPAIRFQPINRPNYIGMARDYSGDILGSTSVALKIPRQALRLLLGIEDTACAGGTIQIRAGDKIHESPVPKGRASLFTFPLVGEPGQVSLSVMPVRSGETCYIVYKHIDVELVPQSSSAGS